MRVKLLHMIMIYICKTVETNDTKKDGCLLLIYLLGSFGNEFCLCSYPDDVFDRYWWPEEDSSWISFGTSQYVTNKDKATGPPSRVMMTAVCPLNNSDALYYSWTADDSSQQFHVYLHFAELKLLGPNMTREFTVCCGNNSCHNPPIRPEYLVTTTIVYPQPLTGQYDYSCSITKTPTSTLPPILNAIEIFIILPLPATPTREEDGMYVSRYVCGRLLSSFVLGYTFIKALF